MCVYYYHVRPIDFFWKGSVCELFISRIGWRTFCYKFRDKKKKLVILQTYFLEY